MTHCWDRWDRYPQLRIRSSVSRATDVARLPNLKAHDSEPFASVRGGYWLCNTKAVDKWPHKRMCICVGRTTMLGRIGISGMLVLGSDFKTLGIIRGLGRHRIPGIVADSQPSSARFTRPMTHRYRWHGSIADPGRSGGLLTIGRGHELQDWVRVAAYDDEVGVQETRNGLCTLLDINVRPRDWQTLRIARGLEMPHVQYHHMTGAPIPTSHMYPRYGMRRVRTATDALAGALVARVGTTIPSRHGWSFIGRNAFSMKYWSGLLPPLGDLAMLPARFAHKIHITPTKETRI